MKTLRPRIGDRVHLKKPFVGDHTATVIGITMSTILIRTVSGFQGFVDPSEYEILQ